MRSNSASAYSIFPTPSIALQCIGVDNPRLVRSSGDFGIQGEVMNLCGYKLQRLTVSGVIPYQPDFRLTISVDLPIVPVDNRMETVEIGLRPCVAQPASNLLQTIGKRGKVSLRE